MLLGGLLSGGHGPGWAQSSIFTCTDNKGRRLTSDRLIAECNDRVQRELSPSGTLRREVGPTLTATERAVEDEKKRKAADEQARQANERKRTSALLNRYPDRAAHDKERAALLAAADRSTSTDREAEKKRINQRFDGELGILTPLWAPPAGKAPLSPPAWPAASR